MKTATMNRGSVAIDTVPLPDKVIGMPTKIGTIRRADGVYYAQVASKKYKLSEDVVMPKGVLRQLLNKRVLIVFSLKNPSTIVAIGTWPTPENPRIKKIWGTCYIPVPDIIRTIQPAIRKMLLDKMVSQKIISVRLQKEITLAR